MRTAKSPRALLIALLCLSMLLAVVACSSGDDDDDGGDAAGSLTPQASIAGPQPQPYSAQPLAAEVTQPADGAIEISAANTLFEENNLAVDVASSIVLRVTNNDNAPHNLRLAGTDGVFDTEDDAISVPDQIDPGQVGELTFAPPAAGYYTFRCDFHPTSMGGMITAGQPEGEPPTPEPSPTPSETPAEESTEEAGG